MSTDNIAASAVVGSEAVATHYCADQAECGVTLSR